MDARTAVVLESRPMSPPAAPVHPVTPLNELARAEAAPSFSPLYRQIKGLILKGLQAGEWKAGETIPSEMDLAARFGVSQGTVRKAVDELVPVGVNQQRAVAAHPYASGSMGLGIVKGMNEGREVSCEKIVAHNVIGNDAGP